MVTKKEVEHIAKLARLGLTEKEINKFQQELSSILDYVEKLKEVDVSDVEPLSHPFEIKNVTRKDEEKTRDEERNGNLQKLMPETKEGYLKVKSVF